MTQTIFIIPQQDHMILRSLSTQVILGWNKSMLSCFPAIQEHILPCNPNITFSGAQPSKETGPSHSHYRQVMFFQKPALSASMTQKSESDLTSSPVHVSSYQMAATNQTSRCCKVSTQPLSFSSCPPQLHLLFPHTFKHTQAV